MGFCTMTNHASVTLSAIEKIAQTSLKAASNTLSDQYVRLESAAHDNIKIKHKFPLAKHEKKINKGNKKTMERDKARRDKYEKCVSEW